MTTNTVTKTTLTKHKLKDTKNTISENGIYSKRRGIMKTNKIYKDALTLILTAGSHSSMQNKWLKIEMSTEDPRLKYFAASLRRLYGLVLKSNGHTYTKAIDFEGTQISGNVHTIPLIRQKHALLKEYLEPIIASEQPQWQIIALQHGWTPPTR